MAKSTGKQATASTRFAAKARRTTSAWTPPVRASAYVAAKAVGSFVPKLTQKAFEKYGFSTATLLTDWALIAGEDLSAATLPERVKWPRGPQPLTEADMTADRPPGATLVLRVDPSRALDVEYRGAQLIDRINRYFGYRAIAELRILQAPIPLRVIAKPVRPRATPQPAATGQDPLTAALCRFEAGVLARARSA